MSTDHTQERKQASRAKNLTVRKGFSSAAQRFSLIPSSLKGRFFAILIGVVLPGVAMFGVLQYDMVKRALLNEVDESLEHRASEVAMFLDTKGITKVADLADFRLSSIPLARTSAPEVYVALVDRQGKTLWTSENLAGTQIPMDIERFLSEPGFKTQLLSDGLKIRKYSKTYHLEGAPILIVVVESLFHLDRALKASISGSMLLGVAILFSTVFLGVYVLRSAFEPLEVLVMTAERIASTDDVTQRVDVKAGEKDHIQRAGEAFNSLMDRMEQLLETARQLLADTSHELRNPLTVLMTDLDLLRKELSVEEREEVISEAQATVARMTRLVRDLLLLSRIEAYSEPLNLVPTNAATLLARVARRLKKALEGGERLAIFVPEGADIPLALIEPERTEQILTNLIENAIFYSKVGPIELSLSVTGENLILAVRDFGCGIPEFEQKMLFERFFRIDRSRTRSSGGSGLGLPVARALARAQGGEITVESVVDVGSCFRLHCRIADFQETQEPVAAKTPKMPSQASKGSRRE